MIHAGTMKELSGARSLLVRLPPSAGRPRQAIVVLDDGGEPRAYLNECRHIPVPLDGGTGQVLDHTRRFLMCGTHGALYEPRHGLCVSGPCRGTRLHPIPIERRGDDLFLLE